MSLTWFLIIILGHYGNCKELKSAYFLFYAKYKFFFWAEANRTELTVSC